MHRFTVVGAGAVAMAVLVALLGPGAAAQGNDPKRFGAIYVQCPGDSDGDAIPDAAGIAADPRWNPKVKCMHLAAGDGMVTMADGKQLYTFGFSDVTGKLPSEVM